jgi:hypothetical protein
MKLKEISKPVCPTIQFHYKAQFTPF